jgi:large subunit ribosomal protein L30
VSDKAPRTIRIQWVRSGIGFTYHQKRVVRSLGLKRLNQEVEKPDTPQIRGLVAKVPHLVRIVEETPKPAWTSVPEHTIYPPTVVRSEPAGIASESPAVQREERENPAMGVVTAGGATSADENPPTEAETTPGAAADPSRAWAPAPATEKADPSGKQSEGASKEASAEGGVPEV